MYVSPLLILALCIGFSAPAFASTHLMSQPGQPPGTAAEDVEQKKIIEAKSLATLVHNNKRVQVQDAIIRGPLELHYATINELVSFINCEFEDAVDFSYIPSSVISS